MELAKAEDAKAIATSHVDVWRATYADLEPRAAYEALGVNVRLPQWQAALADPASAAGIFVVRSGSGKLGFAKAQLDASGPMEGLGGIEHLYVSGRE